MTFSSKPPTPNGDAAPEPELRELAPRLAALCWVVAQDEALQHALRPELEPVPAVDPRTRFVVFAVTETGHVLTGRTSDNWSPEQERLFREVCASIGRVGWQEGQNQELG